MAKYYVGTTLPVILNTFQPSSDFTSFFINVQPPNSATPVKMPATATEITKVRAVVDFGVPGVWEFQSLLVDSSGLEYPGETVNLEVFSRFT